MKRFILLLLIFCGVLMMDAQNVADGGVMSLVGRTYEGFDILNQEGHKADVEADMRLEFVSDTEVKVTPAIKAKPGANFMLKLGMKMAAKKMAKAMKKNPKLKYTVKDGQVTIKGGGKKGKGDAVYKIADDGNVLRFEYDEVRYSLNLVK